MRKAVLMISIFFLLSTPVPAQKTVKKNPQPPAVESVSTENSFVSKQKTSDQTGAPPFDAPVKILYKPRAAYPDQDRGSICFQGTVSLKVEFTSSGQIGKILVIAALPFGATENSIAAARKIKFEPARKDGKPVTIFKIVEYAFTF